MSDNITIANALTLGTVNTPLDARARVATLADVANIQNPELGAIFYCVETGKHYKITALASKTIGALPVENAAVGSYEELVTAAGQGTTEIVEVAENIATLTGTNVPVGLRTNSGAYYPVEKGSIVIDLLNSQVRLDVSPYLAYENVAALVAPWTIYYASGTQGDKGDNALSFTIGTVTTLAAGVPATATATLDENGLVTLNLGIPQGDKGDDGADAAGAAETAVNTHNTSASPHVGRFEAAGAIDTHNANASAHSTLFSGLIKNPISIPSNSDLNSYTNPGFYKCATTVTAVTLSNCPTTFAFGLQVIATAYQSQILYEYNSSNIWSRCFCSNTWTPWVKLATETDLNGMIKNPIDIPSGADLNTYTSSGVYRCGAANVATLVNCPTTQAFSLTITHASSSLTQTLCDNTGAIWHRNGSSVSWTPWKKIATETSSIGAPNYAQATTLANATYCPVSSTFSGSAIPTTVSGWIYFRASLKNANTSNVLYLRVDGTDLIVANNSWSSIFFEPIGIYPVAKGSVVHMRQSVESALELRWIPAKS